ncbi:hypothetical protein pb186bvf_009869 [Paramecium bursaria]
MSTNNLFMQNFTIINDNSLISSINCNSIILSKVYIFGNSNILLQNIHNVLIDRFYVQSSSMNSTLLFLKNIQRLELKNIYIQIYKIEKSEVLYLYNILEGEILNLRIILNNTITSTIMWTEKCELFEFIQVHITDQNNSNSIYFWNEDCYYVLFQKILIMGELAENSSAILLNTQLLIFQGDELFIWNCNFSIHTSLIIRRIIDVNSINAMIENFVLKEIQLEDQLQSINQLDQIFIIKIKITEFGLIKQLKILNLELIQYGLLQLQSNKLFIQELRIADINFRSNFDSCLVKFEGYNDNSNYKILNTLFDSIQLFSIQRIIMNLICVKGVKKINFEQTKFQYISSTNKNQGFLLKINSTKTFLTNISVISCIKINLINIESYAFYLTNLEYNLSSGENLFAIGGKRDQIIKFDNINLRNLQGSVVVLNTSKRITINIHKLNINKFSQSNLFDMQGMHLRVKFEYLTIIQHTAEECQDNEYLFKIITGKNIKISHLYINYVQSQFLKVQLAEIVSLQYIIIQNFNNIQRGYLIGIMHSQIFLQNIYLYNIINQFGIIYLFQQEQISFMANMFIKNCSNIGRVIAIDQGSKKDSLILISSINIMKSQIQQMCVFYSQRNMISIHELYMDHTPSYMITGIVNLFEIHNSILNDCQQFVQSMFVNQSELIGDNVNFYVNQKLENTLLYNPAKQFIYQDSQLVMSLSFGFGKRFLQVSKSNDLSFNIQKINQKEYFYVPTGCLLSDYKRIDFQKIQYGQLYKGFYLVIKGSITQNTSHSNFTCEQQQLYNEKLIDNQNYQFLNFTALQGYNNMDQVFRINPYNNNYTVFKIICESIVDQQIIQLQYKVRSFPCQLGEVLQNNQCLVCNVNESKYSVTYNATKCQYIDYSKIKQAKPGLIELQQNYWRFKFNSQIIEFCDSEYCRGGWIPGDQSCVKSRIGALCKACDLYNIKGDGHFTNNNGECIECKQLNLRFVSQFLFAIIFQLFVVLTAYYSNNNISKQCLMFRVGFRQFYQILYRQSVNQPSIIIKMYTNYLFMFYIIRQNFDLMGELFVININIMNNPNLIFQAQLQCLLSQLSHNYIYTQFYYQIILLFFFLAFVYMIYLLFVLKKVIKFKIGFLIFCTEGIFLFHLKRIIDSAFNLLRYKEVSGVKFVRSNQNDLFYSDRHIDVIIFHIIPLASTLIILPILFLLLTKKLVIINRKVKKIFSLFFQEYKASVFYWEYITIYLRYAMMLLITFESEQLQLLLLVINMLLLTNYIIQPYYLKNLNQIDFILVLCFSIQINLVNFIQYQLIVYPPILMINIYLAYLIIYSSYTKVCILYRKNLIDYKQKIVRKIPTLSQISGLNEDLRNNQNLDTLRFITKVKFTSNKSTPRIEQLSYHDPDHIEQNKKLIEDEIGQIQVQRTNNLDQQ